MDLAAAFIPSLSEQRSFVYYSTTTLDEGEWLMVMRRPRESASGSGLLAPFDFWVWILIFVSLLAVGPIIYVLIIIRNRLTGDSSQQPYSLGHCAWFVYGALMKQGSTLSPIAGESNIGYIHIHTCTYVCLYIVYQAINPNAAISIGNLQCTAAQLCLAAHAIVQFVLSIIECTI